MIALEILFWVALGIVFYTYVGYGIVLYAAVRIKEWIHKPAPVARPEHWPPVTLLIAAYNEELVVQEKMDNTLALNYPADLLRIVWVTDGSDDSTNDKLSPYSRVRVLFDPQRKGKTAALNRAVPFLDTEIVIFTDANTLLNAEAVCEIVKAFGDPKVGCVAGEKRVEAATDAGVAAGGEGFYWKYESALKRLDGRLYSAMGAAGELFAVRKSLFRQMPQDTLLDDFVLSMTIVAEGYKIAYCPTAYAVEGGSKDMTEEAKRKVRIAAGGIQSVIRLKGLLNLFRYPLVGFQYISHRVLRWTLTPIMLFLLLSVNLFLAIVYSEAIYSVILCLQIAFYILGGLGMVLAQRNIKIKMLYIPYYFLFMNANVIRGFVYLAKRERNGNGAWEKSKRA